MHLYQVLVISSASPLPDTLPPPLGPGQDLVGGHCHHMGPELPTHLHAPRPAEESEEVESEEDECEEDEEGDDDVQEDGDSLESDDSNSS